VTRINRYGVPIARTDNLYGGSASLRPPDPTASGVVAPDGPSPFVLPFNCLPLGSRFDAPGVVPSGIWLGYSPSFRIDAPTLGARAEDLLMPAESALGAHPGTLPHHSPDR